MNIETNNIKHIRHKIGLYIFIISAALLVSSCSDSQKNTSASNTTVAKAITPDYINIVSPSPFCPSKSTILKLSSIRESYTLITLNSMKCELVLENRTMPYNDKVNIKRHPENVTEMTIAGITRWTFSDRIVLASK